MIRIASTFLGLWLASGAPAFGAVIYDFSGVVNMFGTNQSFRYASADFITADVFVPAAALDDCVNEGFTPCFGVEFLPSGPDTPEHFPELKFQTANPDGSIGSIFYYFPLGTGFAAAGTFATVPSLGNAGTLSITAVPEPGSWPAGAVAALAILSASARRRTRRVRC
jgi:hypothetical protein